MKLTITDTQYKQLPERLQKLFTKMYNPSSEEVRECFPDSKSKGHFPSNNKNGNSIFNTNNLEQEEQWLEDSGNASRFFKSIIYTAKASKSDRGEGNTHATVKPIALMEYLIKMVTKEGGTVLDPFTGSGTTLVAAKRNLYNYIGFELSKEYCDIIEARLKSVQVGLF